MIVLAVAVVSRVRINIQRPVETEREDSLRWNMYRIATSQCLGTRAASASGNRTDRRTFASSGYGAQESAKQCAPSHVLAGTLVLTDSRFTSTGRRCVDAIAFIANGN